MRHLKNPRRDFPPWFFEKISFLGLTAEQLDALAEKLEEAASELAAIEPPREVGLVANRPNLRHAKKAAVVYEGRQWMAVVDEDFSWRISYYSIRYFPGDSEKSSHDQVKLRAFARKARELAAQLRGDKPTIALATEVAGVVDCSYNTVANGRVAKYAGEGVITLANGKTFKAVGHPPKGDAYSISKQGWVNLSRWRLNSCCLFRDKLPAAIMVAGGFFLGDGFKG